MLRAVVAHAGNDHRLGANEAPPAIISIFLGEQLTDIFEQIKAGGAKSSKGKGSLTVGVDILPPLPKDAGDRNRTSPFAFTGNRFEFRAVGSSQSIAGPLVAMNTIVAESFDYCATRWRRPRAAIRRNCPAQCRRSSRRSTISTVRWFTTATAMSTAWHQEAGKRGLPNFKTTVDSLPTLRTPEVIELFEKYNVLSKRETESRMDIYLEQYIKTVNVEAKQTIEMSKTMIFPAAIRYQGELAVTCAT